MMDNGSLRNLDDIQEGDDAPRVPRAATALLLALGAAAIGFAVMALGGRAAQSGAKKADPLGDLVAQKGKPAAAAPRAADLAPSEVTFPGLLSDDGNPTTALAAVRPGAPAAPPALPPPPPAADKLPVMPVPAQDVLQATPVVTHPRDTLTKAATDNAQLASAAPPTAPAGHDGGYQLQVSSFRTSGEANAFADQLRARGHKAYVQEATVPGRGTWYRVRVGPFASQHAAASYRAQFETKEHVVPFIVPPKGAKE